MSDLEKGVKNVGRWIGRQADDVWDSMKEGSLQIAKGLGYEKAGITPAPKSTIANRKRALEASMPKVIPMPDDEELKRTSRRRQQRRNRGRESTILSMGGDSETLG